MIVRTFLILWVLVLLYGCSDNQKKINKYDGFEETVSLKSTPIEVPSVLLYPRNLFLLKEHLIVLNEKTDTLFQMFGMPDLKYQGQFGIKGEGPEDFTLPSIQAVSQDKQGFTLNDMNRLKSISVVGSEPHISSVTLPYEFPYFNGLVKLKDSLYCCNAGYEAEYELRFLYPDGNYKDKGEYPEGVKPRFKSILTRNQAYNSLLIAKPDGARLAVFYQHARRFRIYDADGELKTDNILNVSPCQELPAGNDSERYIHPIFLYATDRYIYALNLDMTSEEIENRTGNPNIQIFDWEGHPVKQYHLDCYISSFAVDEQNGCIYGVFIEDENHIYKL